MSFPRLHFRTAANLAIVVLLLLVALTLFSPFYQTNDDIAMRLLAEGNFVPGDEPLPFLMFINVILGKIISLAYELTPAIPWYDCLLGGAMIAAAAALISVWIGSGTVYEIALAALIAAYFLLPTFVSVQFSLAGMGCAAAGAALIASAALETMENERRRRYLQYGAALFFMGSLIRFEGAVLIAIEAAALFLPMIASPLRDAEKRPHLRRALIAAGLASLLATGAFIANQLVYRQARGWQSFYEYNLLRSRLGEYITPDRLSPEATASLAKEIGWSNNDFALFRNWFFTDPHLFSLEKVRQAERLFYGASNKPAEDARTVRLQRAKDLARSFFVDSRWAFLAMAVLVVAYGLRPKLLLYLIGVMLTLGILNVAISLSLKAPPQRISWPMLILAVTALAIAARRWGQPAPAPVRVAAILLGVFVVAIAVLPLKKESDARELAAAVAQSDVAGLKQTGASMFVLHADAFPYEDFWRPLHRERAAFDFVGLGASARTPPVQDFLTKTGRADLPWSLCTDPSMLIVAAPYIPPMLVTFVSEHRGVNVRFDRVFEGTDIVAWKCQRI
jgi:hypothetical protein